MGNEQSQQEFAEGNGVTAGVTQPNAVVSARTGTDEEDVCVAPPPDVDLSNLSEEERKMILSVMARAQDLDKDITLRRRSAELSRAESLPNSVTSHQVLCPACHVTELTIKTSAKCSKCGKTVCDKCGLHPMSEEQKLPWICNACARNQAQPTRSKAKSQSTRASQDDVRKESTPVVEVVPEKREKIEKNDELSNRRQIRSPGKSRRESVEVVVVDDKEQIGQEAKIKSVQKSKDGIVRVSRTSNAVNGDLAPPHRTQRISRPIQAIAKSENVIIRKLPPVEVKSKKGVVEIKPPTEAITKRVPANEISTTKTKLSAHSTPEESVFKSVEPNKIQNVPAPTTDVITTSSDISPILDRPIISIDVTVVSRSSTTANVILSTTSKPGMANTMATISTHTTTTKSKAASDIRSSTVSIVPPETIDDKSQPKEKVHTAISRTEQQSELDRNYNDLYKKRLSDEKELKLNIEQPEIKSLDSKIEDLERNEMISSAKTSGGEIELELERMEHWSKEGEQNLTRGRKNEERITTSQNNQVRSTKVDKITLNMESNTLPRNRKTDEQKLQSEQMYRKRKTEERPLGSDESNLSRSQMTEKRIAAMESNLLLGLKKSEDWTSADTSTLSRVKGTEKLTESPIKWTDSTPAVVCTTEAHSNELVPEREISIVSTSLPYSDESGLNYQVKTQQELSTQVQSKQKPKTIDLQSQKKIKPKVETADWSPVSDLSPILDVSPSLEAAEQELMEKFRHRSDSEGSANQNVTSSVIPRATSGTISGMLADFNKALGLLDTSPIDDTQKQEKSPSESPSSTAVSLPPVTTELSVYHPVRQQRTPPQPGTPRRTRRLPQPTMEQMQAAVAMAAHGPRDKQSIAMTSVSSSSTSLPVTTSQRPVSPIMPWRTIDSYLMSDTDDYETRLVSLHNTVNTVSSSIIEEIPISTVTTSQSIDTSITTEQPSEQRENSDQLEDHPLTPVASVETSQFPLSKESDGQTDLESIKLSKLRRKLPTVPSPDFVKDPNTTKRLKDRTRTLSTGATPIFTQNVSGDEETASEEIIQTDDTSQASKLNSQQRSASADGDYVRNLSPTRQSYSPEPIHSFASRKELSVSQGNLSHLRTPSPLLGSDSRQIAGTGTNLPAYMKTLKQQLRDELKAVTEERKRAQEVRKERDYFVGPESEIGYVVQPWQEDASLQYDTLATHRKLLHPATTTPPPTTMRRQTSSHTSPRKGRRRHTSDVPLRPFSPIKEDKSSEGDTKVIKTSPIDPNNGQVSEMSATEKIKDSTGTEMEQYFQQYSDELANRLRVQNGTSLSTTPPLSSDSWIKSSNSCYLTNERKKQRKEKKSRKPRSWHPSPYVSEDEDEQMTREEKKAKIKAEIARRRQQIQENARLHEELVKLAKSREKAEQMEYSTGYKMAPSIDTMYRTSHTTPITRATDSMLPGDTTSVLQAIDEILRKETQGVSSVRSSQYYNPSPATMYSTMPTRPRYTPHDSSWYQREPVPSSVQFPDNTAEDESIARIASTFPADNVQSSNILVSKPTPLIDLETPPETDPTPAMPLLPDMPSRSRKLLEDLGSSPIGGQSGRNETVQPQYRQGSDCERQLHIDADAITDSSLLRQIIRKTQRQVIVKTPQKYEFPVKRILLTRDPKDRSVSGNGLGMKVVGGKEIPGGNGLIGAYVAKVCPGGVVETLGEVREGNQVLEWNGVPLTGRTYEEVQKIISVTADEVEIVIRSDFNMLEPMVSSQGLSPAREGVSPCSTPSDSLKAGTPGGRTPSPCSSVTARRVSSPASTPSSISTPTYDNIPPSHLGNVDKGDQQRTLQKNYCSNFTSLCRQPFWSSYSAQHGTS